MSAPTYDPGAAARGSLTRSSRAERRPGDVVRNAWRKLRPVRTVVRWLFILSGLRATAANWGKGGEWFALSDIQWLFEQLGGVWGFLLAAWHWIASLGRSQ